MSDDVLRFCGTPPEAIALADAQTCAWPDGNVPWAIVGDLPHITEQEMADAITWGLSMWAAVCNIKPVQITTARSARVLVGSRAIDHPGGILAETELPCGTSQVHLWFDTSEAWLTGFSAAERGILLAIVAWHELGHALGLGHAPDGSNNIMAPIYNPNTKKAGPWDIAEADKRYGVAAVSPSTPTPSLPPVPVPTKPTIPGVDVNGLIAALQNLMKLLNALAGNANNLQGLINLLTKLLTPKTGALHLFGNLDPAKLLAFVQQIQQVIAVLAQLAGSQDVQNLIALLLKLFGSPATAAGLQALSSGGVAGFIALLQKLGPIIALLMQLLNGLNVPSATPGAAPAAPGLGGLLTFFTNLAAKFQGKQSITADELLAELRTA